MKKVLFVLILFLSCYIIYHTTKSNKLYYASIGDYLLNDLSYFENEISKFDNFEYYDDAFVSYDYRITDVIKMLNYNENKNVNGKNININRVLKEADVLIISLGMNELNYKFNNNDNNIYSYMNNMLNDMEKLFIYIDKFNHHNVYILGYYDNFDKEDEINYINTKLKILCSKYNFIYLDLSNAFNNNPTYFNGSNIINNNGYLKISQLIVEKIKNT